MTRDVLAGVFATGVAIAGCSNSNTSSGLLAPAGSTAGRGADGGPSAAGEGSSQTQGAGVGSGASLPPEVKIESNFESPVATGKFVWIPNPSSGRVAFIDAQTFAVKTVQAGAGPTYIAAVPDPDKTHRPPRDMAIVIDVQSAQATLLAVTPGLDGGAPAGIASPPLYPVAPYANAWAVSKSGRWAIAWTDTSRVTNPPPLESYNRAAIIDVTNVRPPTIVGDIGFRPVQLAFAGDETQAYVVSSDGIAVIDLADGDPLRVVKVYSPTILGGLGSADAGAVDAGPEAMTNGAAPADEAGSDAAGSDAPADANDVSSEAAPPDAASAAAPSNDAPSNGAAIDGGDDLAPGIGEAGGPPDGGAPDALDAAGTPVVLTGPVDGGGAPDVSFTHDGRYALVRQDGVAAITVLTLATGRAARVVLPDLPTDLALSPDGTFAVAVLRASSSVVKLPIPAIAADPSSFSTMTIPGETIGRAIVAGDNRSVLLFTTVANVDRITILTLGAPPAVRTVALHAPVLGVFPTDDGKNAIVLHDVSSIPGTPGAFSILPIASALPAAIQPLVAPPVAVALTDDHALVTVNGGPNGTYAVYRVDLTTLVPTQIPLASPPLAVGVVAAASVGYVAQDYPDGRITFVDLGPNGDAGARTITGFELSAGIVQGSEQ